MTLKFSCSLSLSLSLSPSLPPSLPTSLSLSLSVSLDTSDGNAGHAHVVAQLNVTRQNVSVFLLRTHSVARTLVRTHSTDAHVVAQLKVTLSVSAALATE